LYCQNSIILYLIYIKIFVHVPLVLVLLGFFGFYEKCYCKIIHDKCDYKIYKKVFCDIELFNILCLNIKQWEINSQICTTIHKSNLWFSHILFFLLLKVKSKKALKIFCLKKLCKLSAL